MLGINPASRGLRVRKLPGEPPSLRDQSSEAEQNGTKITFTSADRKTASVSRADLLKTMSVGAPSRAMTPSS